MESTSAASLVKSVQMELMSTGQVNYYGLYVDHRMTFAAPKIQILLCQIFSPFTLAHCFVALNMYLHFYNPALMSLTNGLFLI